VLQSRFYERIRRRNSGVLEAGFKWKCGDAANKFATLVGYFSRFV
jgi:hypothetical protein